MSARPQGAACQGCGAPGGSYGVAGDGLRACAGRPKGLGPVTALTPTAVIRPMAGGVPLG